MAIKATASTRAPRGTKTLTQAFFSAADSIPEAQRDAVVKAAVAAIRDQLKADREKAKLAEIKAKEKASKASIARSPKVAAPAATKQPMAAIGKEASAKPGRKVARKSSPTPVPASTPEEDTV